MQICDTTTSHLRFDASYGTIVSHIVNIAIPFRTKDTSKDDTAPTIQTMVLLLELRMWVQQIGDDLMIIKHLNS